MPKGLRGKRGKAKYVRSDENVDRAARAQEIVEQYTLETRNEDLHAITDLLTDLRHLCAQRSRNYGSFERADDSSFTHFTDEAQGL